MLRTRRPAPIKNCLFQRAPTPQSYCTANRSQRLGLLPRPRSRPWPWRRRLLGDVRLERPIVLIRLNVLVCRIPIGGAHWIFSACYVEPVGIYADIRIKPNRGRERIGSDIGRVG